jgi:hypothetical protein
MPHNMGHKTISDARVVAVTIAIVAITCLPSLLPSPLLLLPLVFPSLSPAILNASLLPFPPSSLPSLLLDHHPCHRRHRSCCPHHCPLPCLPLLLPLPSPLLPLPSLLPAILVAVTIAFFVAIVLFVAATLVTVAIALFVAVTVPCPTPLLPSLLPLPPSPLPLCCPLPLSLLPLPSLSPLPSLMPARHPPCCCRHHPLCCRCLCRPLPDSLVAIAITTAALPIALFFSVVST